MVFMRGPSVLLDGACIFILSASHHHPIPQVQALTLLPRSNQLALLACVVRPATGQRSTTSLRGKLLHPRFQLWPEVADKALDRPCERLAES